MILAHRCQGRPREPLAQLPTPAREGSSLELLLLFVQDPLLCLDPGDTAHFRVSLSGGSWFHPSCPPAALPTLCDPGSEAGRQSVLRLGCRAHACSGSATSWLCDTGQVAQPLCASVSHPQDGRRGEHLPLRAVAEIAGAGGRRQEALAAITSAARFPVALGAETQAGGEHRVQGCALGAMTWPDVPRRVTVLLWVPISSWGLRGGVLTAAHRGGGAASRAGEAGALQTMGRALRAAAGRAGGAGPAG